MTTAPGWTSLAWRGFASILFGIIALAWPGVTLAALVLLFGAYAFADGALALVVAMQRGRRPHRWLLVFDGLFGIGAGVLTLVWPGLTLLVLVLMVAVRALLMGGVQIGAGIALRKTIPTSASLLYVLGGLCSIALGVVAFVVPGITALVMVTMLAVYALIFGSVLFGLSLALWRESRRGAPHGGEMHAASR